VTFPRSVGQVPIYYNYKMTGRPPSDAEKYTSKYLDAPWTPLYPFGHGLSYTQFRLSDLQLSAGSIATDGRVTVSVTVENVGKRSGDEVVQVYVADIVRSVTPPVQELKGFRRIHLRTGEQRRVEFTLTPEHLGFYNHDMTWVVEPGEFRIRASNSSVGGLTALLEVR
jgi:beta-glucosidase